MPCEVGAGVFWRGFGRGTDWLTLLHLDEAVRAEKRVARILQGED